MPKGQPLQEGNLTALHVPEADMHMPHPLDIFLLKVPTGLFGFFF